MAGVVEINGELYFPIDVLQAYKSWKLIPSSILSDVSFSQTDGGRLGFNVHKYWNPANRPLDEYRIVTPQYLPPAGQVMGTAQLSDAILTVNSTKIEDAIYTIDGCYPMFCLSAIPHEIQNGDVVIDLSGSYKYIPIYDEDLVGAVMPGLIRSTPRETVTAIHDYICNTLTYDESEFNLSSPRKTLTKQGLNASAVTLTVKSGVCEHYAQLFYDMATRAGIPCEKVSGKAGGGNHVWNRVYIDGQWLFVDCTWDDPSWGNLRYNYLLKDAGTMAIDHYWWDTDYPLPTVYDPAWEKIDPNNITTADEFRKCLLAQMVQKKTSITLRVTKSGAYGGLSCCLHADCYGVYYKKLSGGYNSKTNTYNYTVSYWEW